MGKQSGKIEFCSMGDMLTIAKEIYSKVRGGLDPEKPLDFHDKDAYRKKIAGTLNAHIQVSERRTPDDKKEESKETSYQIKVSKEIATFIIGELLCDYFISDKGSASEYRGKLEEKRKKEQEEREEKRRAEYKEKSREKDRQLNEKVEVLEKEFADYQVREYLGEKVDINEYPALSENSDGHKYNMPYGISDLEQVIDRMMIRSLFDMFYDFDDTRFRKDYIERKKLVNDEVSPPEYGEGYSELTEMLENPVGNYVLPRKKIVKDYGSELHIKVDPDTEARLRRYASTNKIDISKAISELIYSQTSTDQTDETSPDQTNGSEKHSNNHKKK